MAYMLCPSRAVDFIHNINCKDHNRGFAGPGMHLHAHNFATSFGFLFVQCGMVKGQNKTKHASVFALLHVKI